VRRPAAATIAPALTREVRVYWLRRAGAASAGANAQSPFDSAKPVRQRRTRRRSVRGFVHRCSWPVALHPGPLVRSLRAAGLGPIRPEFRSVQRPRAIDLRVPRPPGRRRRIHL